MLEQTPQQDGEGGAEGKAVRVMIVDDHSIVRQGLRSMIGSHGGMQVVADTGSAREAVELARQHWPDVILMDITLREINGIRVTNQILKDQPRIKVIGLSMHSDVNFVKAMFRAGALGFLVKSCGADELFEAIETVILGGKYLSRSLSGAQYEAAIL